MHWSCAHTSSPVVLLSDWLIETGRSDCVNLLSLFSFCHYLLLLCSSRNKEFRCEKHNLQKTSLCHVSMISAVIWHRTGSSLSTVKWSSSLWLFHTRAVWAVFNEPWCTLSHSPVWLGWCGSKWANSRQLENRGLGSLPSEFRCGSYEVWKQSGLSYCIDMT